MCAKLTKEVINWLIGWFYELITAVIRYREHINEEILELSQHKENGTTNNEQKRRCIVYYDTPHVA